MKIIKTKFKDLIIYKKESYRDKRGYFRELFLDKKVKEKFPFDVMSLSKKNVLRGLHVQTKKPQGKIITVIKGKIFDVALDLRKNSKSFGKVFSIILSEENSKSIYIPPGFAHGFCTLSKENFISYSCTEYRNQNSETTIRYNDKKLKIKWPIKKMIVSKKDQNGMSFLEYIKNKNV